MSFEGYNNAHYWVYWETLYRPDLMQPFNLADFAKELHLIAVGILIKHLKAATQGIFIDHI